MGIRLNPNTDAKTLNQISTGKKGNKFGVSDKIFYELVKYCKSSKNIKLKCLSVHIGSQILDHQPYKKMLSVVDRIIKKVNYDFEFIDLGGGMGISYENNTKKLNYNKYNDEIKKFLKNKKSKIIFEPGRSIIGNTAVLISKIIYIKENNNKNFINNFPDIYAHYKEKQFTFNDIKQLNRNKLLWRDESADGVKTGHTSSAGYCLVGSAKRGGMRLITVVAGSKSDKDRFSDAQRLLEYGFRFFATQKVLSADQELKQISIWGGLADTLKIGVKKDISLTLPRTSFKDLKINYKHKNNLQAPIKMGDEVGEIEIVSNGEIVYTEKLEALESIESKGFFGRIWSKFILWIMSLFGFGDNEPS